MTSNYLLNWILFFFMCSNSLHHQFRIRADISEVWKHKEVKMYTSKSISTITGSNYLQIGTKRQPTERLVWAATDDRSVLPANVLTHKSKYTCQTDRETITQFLQVSLQLGVSRYPIVVTFITTKWIHTYDIINNVTIEIWKIRRCSWTLFALCFVSFVGPQHTSAGRLRRVCNNNF